jgi:mRNA interferase MazF
MKDYQAWHTLKSKIEYEHHSPPFGEREVWWSSLGANVGTEEDGKNKFFERPVLVVRKFNKEMLWALPLTSREKEGMYYLKFSLNNTNTTIILSQLRVLSAKRLRRKIGKIGKKQFFEAQEAVSSLFGKRAEAKKNGSLSGASGA